MEYLNSLVLALIIGTLGAGIDNKVSNLILKLVLFFIVVAVISVIANMLEVNGLKFMIIIQLLVALVAIVLIYMIDEKHFIPIVACWMAFAITAGCLYLFLSSHVNKCNPASSGFISGLVIASVLATCMTVVYWILVFKTTKWKEGKCKINTIIAVLTVCHYFLKFLTTVAINQCHID